MKIDRDTAVSLNGMMFNLNSILLCCLIGHLTTTTYGWLAFAAINVANCWLNDFTMHKYYANKD